MKMKVFLSAIMLVVTLTVTADEYIDPQTNVVYTYEPDQPTASVKAGYEEVIDMGYGYEFDVVYHPGSPDAAGNIVILDRFTVGTEEYVVTSIGRDAFRENNSIKSVSIPETVTEIGPSAFSFCGNLAIVQLPKTLTRIASNLFQGCSQLVSVNIPSSVLTIENWAFYGCSSLSSITLPSGLITIGRNVFSGTPWYNSLYDDAPTGPFYIGPLLLGYKGDKPTGELVIKEGTTCIGFEAFHNCDGLNSVTFPESVVYVDQDAFEDCTGLKAVHITDLAAWCGIKFHYEVHSSSNPLNYAHHLYLNGEEVTDLVIPEGVTSIGDYAFDNCTALTSVTIPDGVTSIGAYAFRRCEGLINVTIPPSLTTIHSSAFIWCFNLDAVHISDLAAWCCITYLSDGVNPLHYGAHLYLNGEKVTDLVIPEGVTSINKYVFQNYSHLTSVTIPDGVTSIGAYAFQYCNSLKDFYCCAEKVPEAESAFGNTNLKQVTLHVPAVSFSAYQATEPWKNFKEIVAMMPQDDYRPFIEDGKVWKVGAISGNPVQVVDYYYFDGDTIIGGKTCKQMMCQRYVSPDFSDEYWTPRPSLTKVGAWYEEDKKVYSFDERQQTMTLKYDFSLEANDTLHFLNVDGYPPFIIGPKQTGGLEGFKGVYRDIMMCRDEGQNIRNTTWLEGVGGLDAPFRNAYDPRADRMPEFLMSCTVGDEVIYLNDKYEDGATPEGARKNRFDFTHTIKTKPKAPRRNQEELSLYGEYNDLKLGINLNPLDDAYQVHITDESGKVVYEKDINAGNIVGLNIDISAYAKGRYTITVENSDESFTGEFYAQTTGIEAIINNKVEIRPSIYNLQGQRLSSLQKGLNIINGQKIFVK